MNSSLTLPAKTVYLLLILIALGAVWGRIATVEDYQSIRLERYRIDKAVEEKKQVWQANGLTQRQITGRETKYRAALQEKWRIRRPTLSANDRSRWATMRALVEPDMRVPGAPFAIDKVIQQPGWDTIDMVKHDGHLYSSKPTLLPVVQTAVYWILYHVFDLSAQTKPFETVRTFLAVTHLPLLFLLFWFTLQSAKLITNSAFARVFILASVCFGTYLTTFATSVQNHLPGAVAISVALYAILRIVLSCPYRWLSDSRSRMEAEKINCDCQPVELVQNASENRFIAAEESSELAEPAASAKLKEKYSAPGVLLPVPSLGIYVLAGFSAAFAVTCELPSLAFFAALLVAAFVVDPKRAAIGFVPAAALVFGAFFETNYFAHGSYIPAYAHRDSGENWYLYSYDRGDGTQRLSYWHNRIGIDKGEPSRARYAFHILLGHHGVFSLTPIWIFSLVGACFWLGNFRAHPKLALFGIFVLSMTIVTFAFFVFGRPLEDRNYGGVTCAFRWAFWLIPLFLVSLTPVLEYGEQRTWVRFILYAALVLSILAANTALTNPWTHPWIYGGI